MTAPVRRCLKAEIINRGTREVATLYSAVQSLLVAPPELLEYWFQGEVSESIENLISLALKIDTRITLENLLDGEYQVSPWDGRCI